VLSHFCELVLLRFERRKPKKQKIHIVSLLLFWFGDKKKTKASQYLRLACL
jgi:hypothetical protein